VADVAGARPIDRAGDVALVFISLAIVSVPALARNCNALSPDISNGRTELVQQARIDRISARDLLGDVRRARRVRHRQDLFSSEQVVRRVVRQIPRLWTKRVPLHVPLHALRISHRVRAAGMEGSAAVQRSDVSLELPIHVRETRPRLVCKGRSYKVVEGGVVIEFVFDRLPAGGRYHFEIDTEVTVP
jgi:hypothetical protein